MSGEEARSIRIKQADQRYVWHGFTQMAEYEPLVIDRAEGCWLIDVDGRRILDGVSSLWCNVHGHNHPRINAAITEQLHRVAHVTSLGMSNVAAVELAEQLLRRVPASLRHVYYSSDGSSAVEAALKIAFQYWQQQSTTIRPKNAFVTLNEAYHGDTIGSVSLGGMDLFHRLFGPLLFHVERLPCPSMYRLPEGVTPSQACEYYLTQLERLLERRHTEIAAVVIEPLVQGAAGMITHPAGFLRGVRELTKRYDVLMICDEVATGFGRTGRMFACEHEGVEPDLMCLGKGLTGGYLPMAATLASDAVYEAFLGRVSDNRQFFHGHTYAGNPLAAAAAIASLRLFDEEETLKNTQRIEQTLREGLAPLADHPHVGDVRQCGTMVGIELVADRASKRGFPGEQLRGRRICRRALDRGVWVRPLGDVLVLMPPLCIDAAELRILVEVLLESIQAEFP